MIQTVDITLQCLLCYFIMVGGWPGLACGFVSSNILIIRLITVLLYRILDNQQKKKIVQFLESSIICS